MFTRLPDRGTRVKELLHDVVVERSTPAHYQPDYEIIRFPMIPLARANSVQVARAIKARHNLHVLPNGNLLPLEDAPHLAASVERRIARLPEQRHEVELRWTIGHDHPRVYSLSPVINNLTRPMNAHLYNARHPQRPEVMALCIYGPHEVSWNPNSDDPYYLLVWIATFLACDAIQVATGKWLGQESSHSLSYIQKHYGNGMCWCGSGRPMQTCHGLQPLVSATPLWRRY